MKPLRILVPSDGRPGHYHLAEGVAAAVARLRPVAIETLRIDRRRAAPNRVLAAVLALPGGPRAVLKVGYGLSAAELPAADLVVSAGGDTIAANAAIAALRGIPNILCGTLRHVAPERFALVVSSYERHAGLPRHIVCLKPTAMDPDALGRPAVVPRFGPDRPPGVAALLIGGDSGLFHYAPDEWERLLGFLEASHAAHGTRWLVSTSRRTGEAVADAVQALAARSAVIAEVLDYRTAGPGTLPRLMGRAEIALCTEDSSTMISEAIAARLPVVGVAPARHAFKPEEADYRALMLARGWARFMALAELTPAAFLVALAEVKPLAGNHLDALAAQLRERLPALFVA